MKKANTFYGRYHCGSRPELLPVSLIQLIVVRVEGNNWKKERKSKHGQKRPVLVTLASTDDTFDAENTAN